MLQQLGFEHCQGVDGLPSWAFTVVEVSEQAAGMLGVNGVEHLFYLHWFSNLK